MTTDEAIDLVWGIGQTEGKPRPTKEQAAQQAWDRLQGIEEKPPARRDGFDNIDHRNYTEAYAVLTAGVPLALRPEACQLSDGDVETLLAAAERKRAERQG